MAFVACWLHLQVLAQLQSSDTAVRRAGEELLNKSPLQQLLPALAAAASASEEETSSRQLAAVLVRRYAHSKLKDMKDDPEQKQKLIELVMRDLVAAFSSGGPFAVRKAAAEAVGELWEHLPSTGASCVLSYVYNLKRVKGLYTCLREVLVILEQKFVASSAAQQPSARQPLLGSS